MSTATRTAATGRKQRRGNFFEDFRLGQVIRHGTPRTIGEGDIAMYLALTGARHAVHSSAPLAREIGFRSRPLDDLLLFNLAFGKTVPDISLNAVANLGYAEVRFLEPVYAGDTLRCESVVIGLKANSSRQSGVVWVRSTCYREDDAAVLTWVRWVMVRKADPQAPVGEPLIPTLAPLTTPDRLVVRGRIASTAALAGWCDATGCDDLWDSYAAGDRIIHPTGITIEEADHMLATRLYQNNARPHFDALAMRDSHVGVRLVYGGHVISVCRALAYEGLENVIGIAAINGGSHVAPTIAGDTLYACTEVLERWRLPGRNDVGALRLRLLGLKNLHPAELPAGSITAAEGKPHPNVVLDLDHTVLMPRRLTARGTAGSDAARRIARSVIN